MKNGWAKIAVTAVISVLLAILATSWASEGKYVLRCEYETLYSDVQEIKRDVKDILKTLPRVP